MPPRVFTLKIENSNDPEKVKEYLPYCSEYRQKKCQNYFQISDQVRCAAIGFAIHKILSEYEEQSLSHPPLESSDQNGKPTLPQYPELHLTITHSGNDEMSSIGCAIHTSPVGIDIENNLEIQKVPKNEFLHPQDDDEDLGRVWTSKEAYMKAIGVGFKIDPKELLLEDLRTKKNWIFISTPLESNFTMTYCYQDKKENPL